MKISVTDLKSKHVFLSKTLSVQQDLVLSIHWIICTNEFKYVYLCIRKKSTYEYGALLTHKKPMLISLLQDIKQGRRRNGALPVVWKIGHINVAGVQATHLGSS